MQVPDFQLLFEQLPGAHMVLDRDFNYVAVNRAYEHATMSRRQDLIGQNLFERFPNPGEGGRRLRASFERVLETGKPDTLAYIPYDIPRPEAQGGGTETRYWTASHSPVLGEDGKVAFIIQNTVDVTDLVRLREAASLPFSARSGASELIEHAREVEEAHRELLDESDDFRRLFQQAPGFIAVLSGPDHVFTFANDAYLRLIGGRDVVGLPVREALPEIEGQGFLEMLDEVLSKGEERGATGASVLLQSGHDQPLEQFYLDFSYAPIRDGEGKVTGVFVQGMDRTEATLAERRQALLLAELNHRVKNTLATVQSIASQTLRAARDMPSAQRDFEGRILALSRAHNLLSERQWSDAGVRTLVESALSAYETSRYDTNGHDIRLSPKAAIALSMVLHELATNAAKYGALSGEHGKVRVAWHALDGELRIEWRELDGPKVVAPSHQGFGSRMINRVVTGELGGSFDCDYQETGFQCRLVVPAEAYERAENNGNDDE
ncbi:MAG: sensor histidine kinase [Rhizobiaceae bacterium]